MKQLIDFKSLPCNFERELDGRKPNTIRTIDFLDMRFINLALMKKNEDYGKVRIINTETKQFFIRQITDITLWKRDVLISWRHEL